MRSKSIASCAAALSLAVAPTISAAQTRTPTTEASTVQLADNDDEGDFNLGRYGILLPGAVVVALIAAVLFLSKSGSDEPVSP
jgi:hypothetical protein